MGVVVEFLMIVNNTSDNLYFASRSFLIFSLIKYFRLVFSGVKKITNNFYTHVLIARSIETLRILPGTPIRTVIFGARVRTFSFFDICHFLSFSYSCSDETSENYQVFLTEFAIRTLRTTILK